MAEISIEGRRVSYFECGSGTPIVLLHAGAGSGKQWLKTARLLEARFRVIAPDLWGFGDTENWSGEHELTHDDQAFLVVGVIEHLCKEPVHLVGHSYGGATAVRVILRNRELVRTAVLIEPILTPLLALAGEESTFASTSTWPRLSWEMSPLESWTKDGEASSITATDQAPGRHCPKRRGSASGPRRRAP
jgi:pimeloyl-ACP methyl ester carboxylesterase